MASKKDSANAEMVRGENIVNGRKKLAPTLYERCRQARHAVHASNVPGEACYSGGKEDSG